MSGTAIRAAGRASSGITEGSVAASRYLTVRMPPVAAARAEMKRSAAGWSWRKLVCDTSSLSASPTSVTSTWGVSGCAASRSSSTTAATRSSASGRGSRPSADGGCWVFGARGILDDRQRLAVGPHSSVVVDRDRLVGDVSVGGTQRARRGGLAAAGGPDEHHDLPVGRRDARGVQHPCPSARGFDARERHLLREAREHVHASAAAGRDGLDRLRIGIHGRIRPRRADGRLVAVVQRAQIDRDDRADGVDEKCSGHVESLRGCVAAAVPRAGRPLGYRAPFRAL